jgi:hypothetical protein
MMMIDVNVLVVSKCTIEIAIPTLVAVQAFVPRMLTIVQWC